MGILDYFTPEARRGNRQALEGLLMQFIPPEMRPQLNLLAELNPIVSMERAGQDAQQLFAPDQTLMDRLAAGGRMASNMAGVVAPAMVAGRAGVPVANAVQDVLTGYAPMVQPFMADEFGGVGFKAYHGSPHSFDKFSMDKIGTGEGAQAYGHGLYFAENEGIAKSYRDALSPTLQAKIWEGVNQDGMNWQHTHQIARNIDEIVQDEGIAALDEYAPPKGFEDAWARGIAAAKANADSTGGSMYEVQINADPEAFLDWDKPFASADDLERFAAQFDAVDPELRRRIEDYGYVRQQQGGPMPDGNDLLREVFGGVGEKASVRATEMMREAGIPGIKYLDAGSRSTGGTRNYVIFDENLISIVRKYGIAGAAAMLGMSQADVAQAMGQQPQGLLESGPQ